MFITNLRTFATGESGAVTVDWVVLTAAIVGLGLAVMAVVSNGVQNLSGDINTQLQSQNIATTFTSN
ncbi:pilus assembly protein [Roseicyclus sp.]|uniref:pilus assembly protein n=1 Tax=Roseicyclus sp. TaxID=1914329 RepID=UPI003FA150CF